MTPEEFRLNNTLIQTMEDSYNCPRKWSEVFIYKTAEGFSSPAMERGVYFETMCLGSGVQGKVVDDLPRLKNGEKSAIQKRIDYQVEAFKEMFNPDSSEYLGLKIIATDVYLDNGKEKGTIDFIVESTSEWEHGEGLIYHADLKLTGDMEATHRWSWKDPTKKDLNQQYHYQNLWEDMGNDPVEGSLLFVFDYTPSKRKMIIELSNDPDKREFARERASGCWEVISLYEDRGEYPTDPSERQCGECSVKDCSSRFVKDEEEEQIEEVRRFKL